MQLHVASSPKTAVSRLAALKRPGAEGNLAVSGNRVFFADFEVQKVYEIGGLRYEMGTGVDEFRPMPNSC